MSIPLFAYYYLVHNFELLWYIPSSRMWDNNNNRTLKFSALTKKKDITILSKSN